jgi:hypothetical protein
MNILVEITALISWVNSNSNNAQKNGSYAEKVDDRYCSSEQTNEHRRSAL